jgi:hypothetical protein
MSHVLRLPPLGAVGDPSLQGDVFSGAAPFQYHPLSTSEPEIRLLGLRGRIHSCGDVGYTINCELFHVRVQELPRYRCLSYTWGSASDPVHSILVNGQDFKVRENLWQALNRLQSENQGVLIWIDAIWINQEDNDERSEQVRMMRTIYQSADEVCVWLGLSQDDSHLAMNLLYDLHMCAGDENLVLRRFKQRSFSKDLDALAELYCRPYWSRIWITQELVLARSILVFCGKRCVAWDAINTFRKTLNKMSKKSEAWRLFYKNTDDWSLSALRDKSDGPLLIDVTREDLRKNSLALFDTVCGQWPKKASDPRDLIYGLLGIVDERESENIEIDYSKPVAKVYTEFAKQVILDTECLDIVIEANNNGSNMDGLPSWVPDWSKSPNRHARLQPVGEHTY